MTGHEGARQEPDRSPGEPLQTNLSADATGGESGAVVAPSEDADEHSPKPKRRRYVKTGAFSLKRPDTLPVRADRGIGRALNELRMSLLAELGEDPPEGKRALVDSAVYLTLMRDTWAHRLLTVKLDLGDPATDHLALRYFQAERELRETLKALGVERRVTKTVTPAAWLEGLKLGS